MCLVKDSNPKEATQVMGEANGHSWTRWIIFMLCLGAPCLDGLRTMSALERLVRCNDDGPGTLNSTCEYRVLAGKLVFDKLCALSAAVSVIQRDVETVCDGADLVHPLIYEMGRNNDKSRTAYWWPRVIFCGGVNIGSNSIFLHKLGF